MKERYMLTNVLLAFSKLCFVFCESNDSILFFIHILWSEVSWIALSDQFLRSYHMIGFFPQSSGNITYQKNSISWENIFGWMRFYFRQVQKVEVQQHSNIRILRRSQIFRGSETFAKKMNEDDVMMASQISHHDAHNSHLPTFHIGVFK